MLLITMQATCRPRLGWGGGVVQPLPLSHAAEFGTPPSRRPIFMRLGSGLQSKRPELRVVETLHTVNRVHRPYTTRDMNMDMERRNHGHARRDTERKSVGLRI